MLTVVIQAGGRSSRMGQDKALMPFLGRPLVARLVERLAGLGDDLLVITNHPEEYAFLRLPLFGDLLPGSGPLGGLYTALQVANHPLVAVVACDMPFLSPDLLAAQRELLERERSDAVIPHSPDGLEPMHGIYRRETCLPVVKAALDTGERKMIAWFPFARVRVMSEEEISQHDPGFQSFVNVNSPEDFRQAEEIARQAGE
jgi:molybdopterin-guanine dinucleotide biosynthesis protein A